MVLKNKMQYLHSIFYNYLNKSLTRAKLPAYKSKNEPFNRWDRRI